MILARIPYAKDRARREDQTGPQCLLCLRPVDERRCKWVHMVHGGALASRGEKTDPHDAGEMGFFPIGPECQKRVNEAFLFSGPTLE